MRPRTGFRSVLSLTLLIGTTGFAPAAALGGIRIGSTTVTPIPDPSYRVIFNLTVDPHSTISAGASITIYDIPYVTFSSLGSTIQEVFTPAEGPYAGDFSGLVTRTGTITPPPGIPDSPALGNVTFRFTGATPIVNNTDRPLPLFSDKYGELDRQFGFRTVDFKEAVPVSELTHPLNYVSADGSGHITDVGVTYPQIVPEPMSATMILAGLPVLWAFWRRRSRLGLSGRAAA